MGGCTKNLVARSRLAPIALIALVLAASGCGGSSKSATNVVSAGQVDLQLPPGWKVTKNGAVRPPGSAAPAGGKSATAASATGAAGDAVPLAKEDPTTKFFKSLGIFQACLKGLNVKFIGIPDASKPNSPANNPDYIKALSTCAAKSNIVQALKDQQSAQDNLTPAQVETQNKAYLKWRQCMIARGWGIPSPKPDAKGRLFAFGAGGGSSVPNFTPPPGQDLLSSPDVQQCATEVQNSAGSGSGSGG